MWAERAAEAWEALARDAIDANRRTARILDGPGGQAVTAWPLAQVIWAAAEIGGLGGEPPLDALGEVVERLRSGDGYAPTPRARYRYYDDNAWIGLASLRVSAVTGSAEWRARAERLAAFVRTGEHPLGGIRWVEGSESRNTCSTASAAWLLGLVGGSAAEPDAGRWLAWLDDSLRRADGLYADRIEDGDVDEHAWSYNQGAAIAARRKLGLERGDVVHAALGHWTPPTLWAEPPAFLAILVRALLEEPEMRDRVAGWILPYLERLVADARGDDGWFTGGGVGSYDGRPTIDQAAVVQMFALAASL